MEIGITRSYTIDDSSGVGRFVVVVQGAANGGCKKPAAINSARFLGVAITDQAIQNQGVSVCKNGIVRVISGGNIAAGDRLRIHSAAGDVESCETAITAAPGTAAVFNVIGIAEVSAVAGDVFDMFITPYSVNVAVS